MAHRGKENQQEALSRKESIVLATNALSCSKIPVLSKSRLPSGLKQQSCLQQACASSAKNKSIKNPKMPPTPHAGGLEPVAALLPKSLSREPLGEVQLSASGHRNGDNMSNGKSTDHNGVSTVEFLPDVTALASILSNTGLTSDMMTATHKPSLAQRVPLRGNRTCSAGIETARGSLHTKVPEENRACFSCISRSASKDTDHPQSYSLALNTQQLKTLSTNLRNLGPRLHQVEAATPRQPTEDLRVDASDSATAKPSTECLSRTSQAVVTFESSSAGTKAATGSSWKDEEFVPDPVAKASILSNEGLSRFAIGANGKLSLAQRVPVKDTRKPPVTWSSTKDENGFHMRVSQIGKFGRVPCHSTHSLKGLKKSEVSRTQLTNTPGNRCSAIDYSPYALARRTPVTCPQSLHPRPWTFHHMLSSCRKNRRMETQNPTEAERVKLTGNVTPQMGTMGSKQDDTAVTWEKIAVCLFDDEMADSAKKEPAVPVITPEMGKLQRIELLVQFLRQEINNGGVDHNVAPSLEELHKLLSVHCSPALEPAQPGHLSTPSQDPRPNLCKSTPLSTVVVPPETTSNQTPTCPSCSMNLAQPPSSSASRSGRVKQRLDDLLNAPQRFHEACLNDECAFYTARAMSGPQPSVQRCKDPVAKALDAHDALHFIPISALLSPLGEGGKPS